MSTEGGVETRIQALYTSSKLERRWNMLVEADVASATEPRDDHDAASRELWGCI